MLLKNRSSRQTILKNIFWLGSSQVLSRLIRAFIIIYAARTLGASDYGIFSYALGLAGFFAIFSDLGLNSVLTKEIAQKSEGGKESFATALWLKTALLAVTAVLILFIAPYFSSIKPALFLLPLTAFLAVFDGFRDFLISLFRGEEKMEKEALTALITNAAIAIFGLATIRFLPSAFTFTVSYVGSAGLGAIAAFYLGRKYLKNSFRLFKKNLVKPMIIAALPLAFLTAIGIFMLNTDIIMIGWFKNTEEVGWYSAGQKIIQLLYALPVIFASSIFPTLSRLAKNNEKEKIGALLEKTSSAVMALAVPLALGGFILGAPIIRTLYGPAYAPAVLPFQILSLTLILNFLWHLFGNTVFAFDKQKKAAGYLALGAIANIVLNALLIPRWGIAGSALGTMLSQAVYILLSRKMVQKLAPIAILPRLKKISLASIGMAALAWLLNRLEINLILNIFLSGIAYLLILLALKEKLLWEMKTIFRMPSVDGKT